MADNPFSLPNQKSELTSYYESKEQPLKEIIANVENGQCISLVGPPSAGKTLYLRQLQKRLNAPGVDGHAYCVVYMDCHDCAKETPHKFCARLLTEVRKVCSVQFPALEFGELPDATSPVYFTECASQLGKAQKDYGEDGQKPHFIIVLDAVDHLQKKRRNATWDGTFFQWLRNLRDDNEVVFLTASRRQLPDIFSEDSPAETSPFQTLFAPKALPLFTEDDAEGMLVSFVSHRQVTFTGMLARALITQLAGTHPAFLQIAGHYAFNYLQSRLEEMSLLTEADPTAVATCLEEIRRKFAADAQPIWRRIRDAAVEDGLMTEVDWRHLPLPLGIPPDEGGPSQGTLDNLESIGFIRRRGARWVRLSEEFELFIHREKLLNLLQAHPLVLDLEQQRAFLRDQVVELTTNEFRFLECLIRYPPGGVATYAAIKGAIWRDDINPEDRSTKNVQELCARVRRNLGNDKDRIQSVETIGYRFIRDTR